MRELRVPIETFCAFLGIYLAEGWVRGDRDDIIVSQSPNSPDLEEIRQIMATTGLKWHYDGPHMKFTVSNKPLGTWLRANCGHRAWNKLVPQAFKELPSHLLETMLHAMMLGDGHWGPEGQGRYTTTSGQLANDVQEIFQKLGRDAWIRRETTKDYPGRFGNPETKRQVYVVRERLQDYHWLPHPEAHSLQRQGPLRDRPERHRLRPAQRQGGVVRGFDHAPFVRLTEQADLAQPKSRMSNR